jgi:hypothetical protein
MLPVAPVTRIMSDSFVSRLTISRRGETLAG